MAETAVSPTFSPSQAGDATGLHSPVLRSESGAGLERIPTANTTSDGSPPQADAQPQRLAEVATDTGANEPDRRLSGATLTNLNSQESTSRIDSAVAGTQDANGAADTRRRSSSVTLSLRRWSSYASSAFSLGQLPSYLGVTFDYEDDSGKRTWVIKVSWLGRWIVGLHALFALFGLLNAANIIYGWIPNKKPEKMLQKILQAVTSPESHFGGVEKELQKWINETKIRSAAEKARVEQEEHLWNALLQVFEDCATSPGHENATNACDDVRQYFDSHPLPRPDDSKIAKRNLAKLDVIIRRDHLDIKPGGTGASLWSGDRLLHILIGLVILSVGTLTAVVCYLAITKWGPTLRRRIRAATKAKYYETDEKFFVTTEPPDDSVPIYASGGDTLMNQSSVISRGHKVANAHSLAARGEVDKLQNLDSKGQLQADKVDDEYGTLLAAAARSGDVKTVSYVLSRKPDLSLEGGRYHNALQAASHSGNQQTLDRLLAAGVCENSVGGFYGTAVNAAAEKGNPEMLKSLFGDSNVKHFALSSINEPGGTYGYPLIAAAARGMHDSATILLSHKAQIDLPNSSGTIAMHQAAANGHIKTVELLLRNHSPLNQISTVFGTPLHAACRSQQAGSALILLKGGADASIKDSRLRLPLHEAANARNGLEEVLRQILEKQPALVDERDIDGQTALHLASISGNLDAVKILLSFGASCAIGDKFNAQPLFRAAGCGHPDIVWELLDSGKADPNAADCFGRTALHGPAQSTDVQVHEYLIAKNANVNVVGNDKKTPLHEACNMGRIENVKLLLAKSNILVNELDNDQFPPLYKSLCSSDANPDYFDRCVDQAIPKMLLEREDLDVNVSNGIALQEAAKKGFLDFVQTMISKRKAYVQVRGGKYGGVLQAAAISGNIDLVNFLLKPEFHADVNLVGGEYGSPLAAGAAFGHVEIVRRLLEAGADPCITGVGRYGSPWQSICRMVDPIPRAKWLSTSIPIRDLMQDGGLAVEQNIEQPYEGWRWKLTPTGWGWIPPGEM